MVQSIDLTFVFDKDTKNTLRFNEQGDDLLYTPEVGTIYVAKSALRNLGWKQGDKLSVSISIKR